MQLVTCIGTVLNESGIEVVCGLPICRVDQDGNVYSIKAGDDKPRARTDYKGNPVKQSKAPPIFHLDDRDVIEKEDWTKEYIPKTIICRCGHLNKIY